MVEIDIQVSIDLDDGQHIDVDKATAIELRDQLLEAFPLESVALEPVTIPAYPNFYPSTWPNIITCGNVSNTGNCGGVVSNEGFAVEGIWVDLEKTAKELLQSLSGTRFGV